MILLHRKVDYALLILCYLYHRRDGGSAREIAAHFGISRAFAANILKGLCQQWFVTSERGVKGGYHLHPDAAERTLADLMDALDSSVQLAECNDPAPEECCSFARDCPIRAPIARVHDRIRAVLETVRLVEIFTTPTAAYELHSVPLEVSRCSRVGWVEFSEPTAVKRVGWVESSGPTALKVGSEDSTHPTGHAAVVE